MISRVSAEPVAGGKVDADGGAAAGGDSRVLAVCNGAGSGQQRDIAAA